MYRTSDRYLTRARSVVDLIRALLKPEFFGHRSPVLEWLFAGGLFDACVKALRPLSDGAKESRVRDNATDLLTTLLAGARGVSLSSRPYENEKTIQGLFEAMFDEGGAPTSAFAHCIAALTGVVALCRPFPLGETDSTQPTSALRSTPSSLLQREQLEDSDEFVDAEEAPEQVETVVPTVEPHPTVKLVLNRLPQLLNVFEFSRRSRKGSGGTIAVAGQHVIQTIAFIESLVRLRIPAVDSTLVQREVLRLALDVLLRCPLNNFLHTAVEQLVCSALSMPGALRISIVKDCKLPNVIAEGIKASLVKDINGYTSGQKAYGGHLARMAVALVAARSDEEVAALLDVRQ